MAPTTVYCPETEKNLIGKTWNSDLLPFAYELLEKDLPLAPGAPGGMIQFRRTLTTSFFYKFFLRVTNELYPDTLSPSLLSAIPDFHREVSSGKQSY